MPFTHSMLPPSATWPPPTSVKERFSESTKYARLRKDCIIVWWSASQRPNRSGLCLAANGLLPRLDPEQPLGDLRGLAEGAVAERAAELRRRHLVAQLEAADAAVQHGALSIAPGGGTGEGGELALLVVPAHVGQVGQLDVIGQGSSTWVGCVGSARRYGAARKRAIPYARAVPVPRIG